MTCLMFEIGNPMVVRVAGLICDGRSFRELTWTYALGNFWVVLAQLEAC